MTQKMSKKEKFIRTCIIAAAVFLLLLVAAGIFKYGKRILYAAEKAYNEIDVVSEPAEQEETSDVAEIQENEDVGTGYVLVEKEREVEQQETVKDITDIQMGASDRTRLNELMEEIKEVTD